jgi:4-hydroxy-2-oxoheptanedioate aldolase
MEMLPNKLKAALKRAEPQIGLWMSLGTPYTAEVCAAAGFDFVVIDGEHGPNHIQSILLGLQAIAGYPAQAVVRPTIGDVNMIKQILDVGAQTLVVPLVETAEQAAMLVKAVRYPPEGIRGVAPTVARASRWGRVDGYIDHASDEICLILQIETKKGLDNLEAIAAVDGVDGVFIGPADLSASLGYRGKPSAPEMLKIMEDAVARIRKSGKAPGILWTDDAGSKRFLDLGVTFMAVGVDVALLASATDKLVRTFKGGAEAASKPGY